MTERAQPGAIKSLARNDELAQVFGQLIGQYADGWIVRGSEATPASQRRPDIDEGALNAFAISTSGSSLDVTVDPGEAFAGGWVVRDASTVLTLQPNSTQTVVVEHDVDAIYDPNRDADRDAADNVDVEVASAVPAEYPKATLYDVTTNASGVTNVDDRRTLGPAVDLDGFNGADLTGATDGDVIRATGSGFAVGRGGYETVEVFESDGTFDATDIDRVYVEAVGGGGGGGGSNSGASGKTFVGGAGSGGGYAAGVVDVSGSTSVSVTVGDGGAGGSGGNAGAGGTQSKFTNAIVAAGGSGGEPSGGTVSGFNAGGNSNTGDITIPGGAGDGATDSSRVAGVLSSRGGDSQLGSGGAYSTGLSVTSGVDGGQYGGGGTGAAEVDVSSSGVSGGDGADGVVIVRY